MIDGPDHDTSGGWTNIMLGVSWTRHPILDLDPASMRLWSLSEALMTIKLQLRPDVEAELVGQARARGLSLEVYLEQVLQERSRVPTLPLSGGAAERAASFEAWAHGYPFTLPCRTKRSDVRTSFATLNERLRRHQHPAEERPAFSSDARRRGALGGGPNACKRATRHHTADRRRILERGDSPSRPERTSCSGKWCDQASSHTKPAWWPR